MLLITLKFRFVYYRGGNIDAVDQDNSTPIVIAASNGNRETVETLLKRGADLCITDSSEKSSLYWAAEENSVEVLRVKFFDQHVLY